MIEALYCQQHDFYSFYFRSAYCAASVASLTNIITPKLFDGTAEWIARFGNKTLIAIHPVPGCCFLNTVSCAAY